MHALARIRSIPLAAFAALAAILLLLPAPGREAPLLSEALAPPAGQVVETFSSLPLTFEANGGQTAPEVLYRANSGGFETFITEDGVTFASAATGQTVAMQMSFVGASEDVTVVPGEALAGKLNYLIGNDRGQWQTGVPTYDSVRYEQVYAGVDAVLYGNSDQLEYDFIVAPGASPDDIRLRFAGAESLSIDSEGNLVASIGGSEFVKSAPVVYQETGGERAEVEGAYIVDGDVVSFDIGAYDESQTLVIDPILIFSSYLGGGLDDIGFGVATDDDGNVYVTGETTSLNFPTTPGVLSDEIAGNVNQQDVFVTKISADGDEILWSTYLGGTGNGDTGFDIEVDSEGQAFVAGRADGDDFPLTPGAFNTDGGRGGFVTKLSDDGDELLYSTKLGVNTDAFGLEIDGDGQALVGGWDLQDQFDVPGNAFQTEGNGNGDAIVGILNEDGTALVAGTYVGGSMREQGFDVAWDGDGYVYLTGQTPSEDFPTENAFQNTKADQPDAFVVKLMPDLSDVMYSTYLGGDGGGLSDYGYGIDADDDGNAYVTGFTNSSDFPVSGNAFQGTLGGSTDAFVTKFGSNGNMVYSTYLGGSNVEHGAGIAVDGDGNAHVAGFTVSINFPTEDAFQSTHGGGRDAFAAKLNASGSALIYSTYLGGDEADQSGDQGTNHAGGVISVDDAGNAYVVGETSSTDFPTMDPFQPNSAGSSDGFVVKLLGEGFQRGNLDCDGGVAATDALKELQDLAGIPYQQTQPCPAIGEQVQVVQVAGNGTPLTWGDVNCDGAIGATDALSLLRYIAGLAVNQNQPCIEVGAIIQILD